MITIIDNNHNFFYPFLEQLPGIAHAASLWPLSNKAGEKDFKTVLSSLQLNNTLSWEYECGMSGFLMAEF